MTTTITALLDAGLSSFFVARSGSHGTDKLSEVMSGGPLNQVIIGTARLFQLKKD